MTDRAFCLHFARRIIEEHHLHELDVVERADDAGGDADGGQCDRTGTDCLDPLEVEQQDEARDQDEAAAGTDHRAVDADNARKDEQGGDGQRIHGPESGTCVRAGRGARSLEGVILAVMSAESPGDVRPAVSQLPAYRPGKGAAQAEAEHGITDAIKLASNENPYAPIPQVVDAIAAAAVGVAVTRQWFAYSCTEEMTLSTCWCHATTPAVITPQSTTTMHRPEVATMMVSTIQVA